MVVNSRYKGEVSILIFLSRASSKEFGAKRASMIALSSGSGGTIHHHPQRECRPPSKRKSSSLSRLSLHTPIAHNKPSRPSLLLLTNSPPAMHQTSTIAHNTSRLSLHLTNPYKPTSMATHTS
ncbi:unnamed protein product [Dovyalis caffra]|uniref:Uncharacterized protein n=1 Tax=Dovyalis caffra TaxID=77055 RepID=A0AAV1RDK0_9ROSI|nr:unnamed protein product [Dovyalis caffra]